MTRFAGPSSSLHPFAATALLLSLSTLSLADVHRPEAVHVEIRGTGAMISVARQVAEKYMGDHPEAIVTVAGGGASRGLKSVILGTADLALATDAIPNDLVRLARDANIKLMGIPIYSDAVVPIVHPKNPVTNLWVNQLKDIFRGTITNWKEVGGNDALIEVISFDPTQGAYETFKREVLGDDAVMTRKALQVAAKDLESAMTENAIGYAGLRMVRSSKAIRVNGVVGSVETVSSGAYPIRRHLTVYHREATSPEAAKVLSYFLAPDKGQPIIRALGGVPVK